MFGKFLSCSLQIAVPQKLKKHVEILLFDMFNTKLLLKKNNNNNTTVILDKRVDIIILYRAL